MSLEMLSFQPVLPVVNTAPSFLSNVSLPFDGKTPTLCVADGELGPEDELFWIYVGIIVTLVIFAGMMSGLTLGLLSLDIMSLRVLQEAGTEKDRKHAKRILPLVKRHHLLLVTLLLSNAAATEALPIFLDRLLNPIMAVIISVTIVLIFGEVIPQALCSRYGLSIGSLFSPLVYLLLVVLIPVGYPLSKLLDWLLGSDHKTFFRRSELKALVGLHGPAPLLTERIQSIMESVECAADAENRRFYGRSDSNASETTLQRSSSQYLIGNEDPLSYDEVLIIKGALEMRDKTAADALVPIEHTFMLDAGRILDENTLAEIEQSHHSRIPLYENGSRNQIIGCLLVRGLIQLSAADKVPIRRILGTRAYRELLHVDKRMPLYELLSELKTGRSNMAIVHEAADNELLGNQAAQDAAYEASQISSTPSHRVRVKRRSTFKLLPLTMSPVLGIVSLEDVIEELLQEEILDEMDFEVAHSLKTKNVTEACRETMSALSGTVSHIRRLRHAGQGLISRQYTTAACATNGVRGESMSRTVPNPVSLNRSISANIILARSTSRMLPSSSNRIASRSWLEPHPESLNAVDEDDAEEAEIFDVNTVASGSGLIVPESSNKSPLRRGGKNAHHVNFAVSPSPPPKVVVTAAAGGERHTANADDDDTYDDQKGDGDKRWLFSTTTTI